MPCFYAHTKGNNQSEWEPLREHLQLVSERAERFAGKFEAAAWGKTLGWWHDLGKYSVDFQNYLVKSVNTDVHQSETQLSSSSEKRLTGSPKCSSKGIARAFCDGALP